MLEKFASVIKDKGETKSLVVIERDYLKHLSDEFREAHLTSCFSERLFMKMSSGATIYVLVIVSYHVIVGARIHNQSELSASETFSAEASACMIYMSFVYMHYWVTALSLS